MAAKVLQMEGKNISFFFKNGYYELIQPLNESFEKGILRVAYVGKNRNNTYISKKTFEDAIPTIFNCPIVANYSREDDEIGSHDSELVEKDGKYVLVNITQPVGVVPESAKYWWENIEEDDGKIHEYFCIEVILWKRQECYEKIKSNGITDESMEIAINNGEWVDGCYHINNMTFLAFCLLGTAEPCFESASVEVFSKSDSDDFKQQFSQMLNELKSYSKIQSKGENQMDVAEVLSKYNLSFDALRQAGYEIDESTIEVETIEKYCKEFSEKTEDDNENLEEVVEDNTETESDANADDENDNADEDNDDEENPENAEDESEEHEEDEEADFSLSLNDLTNEIYEAVSTRERIVDDYGWEYSRYLFHDVLNDEVIVFDRSENWHLYGIPFSMNGDKVELDWDSKKRKKIIYEDFDNGSYSNTIEEYLLKFASFMNDRNTQLSNQLNEIQEKYNAIKQSQLKDKLNKIFNKFDTRLENCDEYQNYKSKVLSNLNVTVEEVENSCYAFVGKLDMNSGINYSNANSDSKSVKIGIDNSHRKNEESKKNKPYGGIFEED